jgi:hypothetical protein
VHDERVQIVGQASGGGGVASLVEIVCQGLQSLLCVALIDRVIERLPVGPTHTLALALGQLGEQVAKSVNGAADWARSGIESAASRQARY